MGSSAWASPLALQPVPKIVTEHSLREAKDLRRPRVLLAEDNQTNQMAAAQHPLDLKERWLSYTSPFPN